MNSTQNLIKKPFPFEIPENFVPVSLDLYEDLLTNENGCIRRSKVYSLYNKDLLTYNDIKDLFVEWRDDPEFYILRGSFVNDTMQERLFQNNTGIGDTWYLEPEIDYLYRLVKASKRGNDVYKFLVSKKLDPLKNLNEVVFFDEHDVNKKTSLLFITLTYDNKRCDVKTAWRNFGKEYHLFLSNLLKHYGHIEFFRAWESTKNFYPHVHVAVLFTEYGFPVLVNRDKDGSMKYRIPYHEKEKIGSYWHSFVDVQALKTTSDCFRELTKYITKDLCSNKGDITNSMIWLFRKQGYAVSRGFIRSIQGWYIDFNEPTNFDLINNLCNCNHDNIKWEFLGILRGKDLGFFSDLWVVDMKKPPPKVLDLIENENIRWKRLHYHIDGYFNDLNGSSPSKNNIPCVECGSVSDTKKVLGAWVCKKCLKGGEK